VVTDLALATVATSIVLHGVSVTPLMKAFGLPMPAPSPAGRD